MEEHGICQHSQLPAMPGLLLYNIKFPAYVHRYFRNYFSMSVKISMYIPGALGIMIISNGGMVMQFTNSLAYAQLICTGAQRINSKFRQYAKLDDEDKFDAMMELAMETIDESDFKIAYFVRNENEIDEMEYELHMSLQADLTSYLVNEIREIKFAK